MGNLYLTKVKILAWCHPKNIYVWFVVARRNTNYLPPRNSRKLPFKVSLCLPPGNNIYIYRTVTLNYLFWIFFSSHEVEHLKLLPHMIIEFFCWKKKMIKKHFVKQKRNMYFFYNLKDKKKMFVKVKKFSRGRLHESMYFKFHGNVTQKILTSIEEYYSLVPCCHQLFKV